MAIFNSFLYVYQRVSPFIDDSLWIFCPACFDEKTIDLPTPAGQQWLVPPWSSAAVLPAARPGKAQGEGEIFGVQRKNGGRMGMKNSDFIGF